MLHPELSHLLVFRSRPSVVAIRIDGDSSSWRKDTCYLDILWFHQFNQVFHDDIYAILMEVAMITETEEV